MPKQTPSQTVGPFYHIGMIFGGENEMVNERTLGERIHIRGKVWDGDGEPVTDALLEIWQADAQGHFNHEADAAHEEADKHFTGYGRASTSDDGSFWFKTIKPGRVPDQEGQLQAPHVSMRVFARGMLLYAVTRMYFSDEESNESDSILNSIEDVQRRHTLIADLESSQELPTYCFDIHLQGEQETVFFEL